MRKAILLSSFFLLTPIILTLSLSLLLSQKGQVLASKTPKVAYAALPPASGTLRAQILTQDARLVAVRNFFSFYKSDLVPFADEVIEAADKYDIDYRLIPAIAMQESNLCKKAPKNSHNCWGFGIYGKKVTRFDNYAEAIDTVTRTLAKNYKANGLETPEEIMTKYTPGSNGSWARGVNIFMEEIATL